MMPRRFVAILFAAGLAAAQSGPIDSRDSTLTIHVYKAGVFSAFGHDHEIHAPVARGQVDASAKQVEFHVDASALRVIDAKASEKDRAEIQKTMLGPEVLDVARYPEIVFRSTSAESAGANAWRVSGDLTLHGQTHPLRIEVKQSGSSYAGQVVLKQSDFGIKPIRVAGGAVKVKDELRIDFDVKTAGR